MTSRALNCLLLTLAVASGGTSWGVGLEEVVADELRREERRWTAVRRLDDDLTSRSIFRYAFLLCEADIHLDRLPRLLEVAERMQDRDPDSRGFGNFRWKWADGSVLDYNAVEFCMQYGSLVWLRHHETLPPDVRKRLAELIDFSIQGCLKHRVPVSYTNIALMNAENLILLGEMMDRPEVADQGRQRLDAFCLYTAETGIHEFGSPTYYGVDLECLLLLNQFVQDHTVKQQTNALLELFWEDLAANWFAPAHRLGGAHSRDYNYLRGLGLLDQYVAAAGWLRRDAAGVRLPLAVALTDWNPSEDLLQRNRTLYPRWVRQVWGIGAMQVRSHYATPDVSLGTSGANYGAMDMPLTIYFDQPRDALRTYFIPDARRDPYGRKRIPAGGGHEKTLHLKPFWAAVQDRSAALGLVLYRPQDLPALPPTLESHIVFPRDVDEIVLGGNAVEQPEGGKTAVMPVQPGQVLAVRRGSGAFAIRVPWSRTVDGARAETALVFDGNQHGACRLTVAHHSYWGLESKVTVPGAAFWVSVTPNVDEESFDAWVKAFASRVPVIVDDDGMLRLSVPGESSSLVLATVAPYRGFTEVRPAVPRSALWVNGADIGSRLLDRLPVVRRQEEELGALQQLSVEPGESLYWEAESGRIAAPMTVSLAEGAFNSRCVWMPGGPGQKGGGGGTVTWKLDVKTAGEYYLWGRVQAPTPDDDSFFVRVFTDTAEPLSVADWHTGTHEAWEWVPVALARDEAEATAISLPKGENFLQFRVREDGTRLDRLFLTADPNELP